MPEFFTAIQPFMQEFGSNMFNQIGSNFVQSMFARGDAARTYGLTSIKRQVKDMMDSGLNPALAYGQLSSAQPNNLGNYHSDYAAQILARQEANLAKEKVESENANQEYLSALAFKTRMEGINREFLNTHQEDDWKVGFEGRQMDNVHKNLLNTYQFVQNRISEIDWKAKPWIIQGELNRLTADTYKIISEADSINAKLPYELANLAASTKAFLSQVKVNGSQMYLNMSLRDYYVQMKRNLKTTDEGQRLMVAYENWLSNGGTDWTRKRGKEFTTALLNALLNLIPNFNFGLGIYNIGKGKQTKLPNLKDYGPGRDHLGH